MILEVRSPGNVPASISVLEALRPSARGCTEGSLPQPPEPAMLPPGERLGVGSWPGRSPVQVLRALSYFDGTEKGASHHISQTLTAHPLKGGDIPFSAFTQRIELVLRDTNKDCFQFLLLKITL